LTTGDNTVTANLTGSREEPSIRGKVEGSANEARLLVNIRANIDPIELRSVTEKCLQSVAGDVIRLTVDNLRSFAPAGA